MAHLELKVVPPLVFLISGLLMWLLASVLPMLAYSTGFRQPVVVALSAVGLLSGAAAVIAFRLKKTTVHPTEPHRTSYLVTNGIFRLTRNPMYLGLLLLLMAWGFYLQNMAVFVVLPLFVLYINRFQIMPEERMMLKLFGADFITYTQQVRRWI